MVVKKGRNIVIGKDCVAPVTRERIFKLYTLRLMVLDVYHLLKATSSISKSCGHFLA